MFVDGNHRDGMIFAVHIVWKQRNFHQRA